MKQRKRWQYLTVTCAMFYCVASAQASAQPLNVAKNVNISGYVMVDYDSFDGAFTEDSNESESLAKIRRARLSFKNQFNQDWKVKFQLGFANDETEIKDAYLQFQGWTWADITIGKQKEAFGLEKLTSSRNLMMIERSIVTQALAPGRSLGISASGKLSSVNWQIGYYQPEETESATAITGRLTWLPWQQENSLLHLGAAFSQRRLAGSEFRINEKMEVYLSDSLLEGEKLFANEVTINGVEFLWIKNKFALMAEWQSSSVTDIHHENYDYRGGYIQMSYQLSGGSRKYKNAVLGSSANAGWELTSRYSQFELVDENEEAKIFSVGVNYSVNKKLKFMADLIRSERAEQNIEVDSGNAFSLRAQYRF